MVFLVIVVLATFDLAPEDREQFVAAKRAQVERTLTENGCIEYAFSYDATDAGRVRLTEQWESLDALKAHLAALHAAPPPADPGPTVLARDFTVVDGEPNTELLG